MSAISRESPFTQGELVAENLCLTRAGSEVLHAINLCARPGRLLALAGPNGAGKSSLLAALAGLLWPTRGRVTLDGKPLMHWTARALARRRAMLSQNVHMGFGFSAREVVRLGRSPHAADVDDASIAEMALRTARASHLADRNYLQLSGGEQRRVQLARVLAQVWTTPPAQPGWLLLDEPEAGLDIAHQHFVLRLARRMAQRGYGVIAILHDLNLAARYADEIAVMAEGRLLRHGPPSDALEPETLSAVYGIRMRRAALNASGKSWIVVER